MNMAENLQTQLCIPPINAFVKTAFERYRKEPLSLKADTLLGGTFDIKALPCILMMSFIIKTRRMNGIRHPNLVLLKNHLPRIIKSIFFHI